MKTKDAFPRFAVLAALVLAASSAMAAQVNFFEPTGEAGLVTVQATGWISFACQGATAEGIDCSGTYSSGQTGNYNGTAGLLEPDGSNVISDTVFINWAGAQGIASVNLLFTSDTKNNLGVLPAGAIGLIENGQLQDLTSFFNFQSGDLTVLPADIFIGVMSDVSDTVPEPGTLALLGLGFAGLAWRRRRQ